MPDERGPKRLPPHREQARGMDIDEWVANRPKLNASADLLTEEAQANDVGVVPGIIARHTLSPRRVLTIDPDVQAAYLSFTHQPTVRTVEIDGNRMLNFTKKGRLAGVEFLNIQDGVNLSLVPHTRPLGRRLQQRIQAILQTQRSL